jgi:hypothetical protein
MSGFMNKDSYREKLVETADLKPTRLEKRLARVTLAAQDASNTFDVAKISNGPSQGWTTALYIIVNIFIFIFMILGSLVALLPTLLWGAVTIIPLLLMISCINQF